MDKFLFRQELKKKRIEAAAIANPNPCTLRSSDLDAEIPMPQEVVQPETERCTTIDSPGNDNSSHESVELPTDEVDLCQNERCKAKLDSLHKECLSLREEIYNLRQELKNVKFDEISFQNNDEKVQLLTGLPSYAKLMVIFKAVCQFLKANSALSPFEQVILTLLRLRMNLPLHFLGQMYNISTATASRLFNHTIDVMSSTLTPALVFWPGREELRLSLPMSFRAAFSNCVCIIDCFEVFIEKPSDLRARAQTYSQYKHHNTMKYLIGITPQGVVSFISKGWGGRTSDKHITEHSGFLENLMPGDVVLADRGFLVQDSVNLYNAELKIPAFTRGKKQLDPLDIEATRGLAAVRIHVERVIGLVRQKYTILSGTVPINLCEAIDLTVTPLDKIVQLCCALTNVCASVVPLD